MELRAKVIAAAVFLLVYGGAVWHAHSIFDEAVESDALKAQVKLTNEAQQKTEEIAAAARAKQVELETKISQIKDEWNENRVAHKNPDCALSADAKRLLEQARITAAHTLYGAD